MASNTPSPPRPSYDQKTDPSLAKFIRKSDKGLVGGRALEGQNRKRKVHPADVRVDAKPSSETRRNEGLHEGLPTNLRNEFNGSPLFSQLQSGFRTSPSTTVFRREGGELGGHTQTFVKKSGRGSTHTKGQSKAHDKLRDTFSKAKRQKLPEQAAAAALFSSELNITASGKEIIGSDYLTHALPNSLSAPGPLEPLSAPSQPNRRGFASFVDTRREAAKERTFAYIQQEVPSSDLHLFAPPSPLHTPFQPDGSGGEALSAPFPLQQLPDFPTQNRLAHVSAWASQPLRSKKDL